MPPPRLRLTGIRKSFGATQALRSVSLEAGAGEIHALIGENGAGKSTLMKILSGAHAADAGTMELDGRPYAPAGPQAARALGVAMIYQELNLAPHLSAQENILLGSESARGGWVNRRASRERAGRALAQLGYAQLDLGRAAGAFSIAEQQIIEIARALLNQPRVLIMDEPTSSLTQADVEKLFAAMRRLRAQGVSIIYISHFLEEIRRIADRYTVLKDGETAGGGAMAGTGQDEIIRLMVGREVGDLYPRGEARPGATVLAARGLRGGARLREGSLVLREGEILGVAGLIGAGRTDLVRTIFGLDGLAGGSLTLRGQARPRPTPHRSWREGIGFLSENRKEEGLMLGLTIADNLTMTRLGAYGAGGWISTARQHAATARWIERLAIKTRGPRQAVRELSGGTQQKVALARLLEHDVQVFLLDEPTRGIDVGSKAQIYELISGLAARGKAVIFVSSYLPELLGVCHTIAVMCRGAVVASKPAAEWTEHGIMVAATGGI